MESSNKRVFFAGGVFRDLACRTNKFPAPGETILGIDYWTCCGGKSANQSVMCKSLCADNEALEICFLGQIGNDDHGNAIVSNFKKYGINIDQLKINSEDKTGVAFILVDSLGENKIIVIKGASDNICIDHIKNSRNALKKSNALVIGLEMNLDAVTELMKIGIESNIPIIINAAPIPENLPPEFLNGASILIVNQNEATILTKGEQTPEGALPKLMSLVTKLVVMTLGSEGAVFATKNNPQNIIYVPIPTANKIIPEDVIDTTGAGDAFVGAFTYFYVKHFGIWDTKEIIERACILASLTVKSKGTQTSYPLRKELDSKYFEK